MPVIAFLLLVLIINAAAWIVLRIMGRIPFRVTFTPANTICLIVTEENESGDGAEGAGNLVDAKHAVPGEQLIKTDPNPMKWHFEDGEDPEHQNFLFRELGLQDMGGWFYTTRVNIDRRARFSWDEPLAGQEKAAGTQPHTVTKERKRRHVFYSGEITVRIEGSDTADKLGLIFEIEFGFKRKYPVLSILKLADTTAFLVSKVHSFVNSQTSSRPAADFYGGPHVGDNRKALGDAIKDDEKLHGEIETELGLDIVMVSVRLVDMSPEHKRLMEAQTQAEKLGDAEVTKATKGAEAVRQTAYGDRDAKMARAEGDKKYVEDVLIPMSENATRAAVFAANRDAEALESLENLTTLVQGGGAVVAIPPDAPKSA